MDCIELGKTRLADLAIFGTFEEVYLRLLSDPNINVCDIRFTLKVAAEHNRFDIVSLLISGLLKDDVNYDMIMNQAYEHDNLAGIWIASCGPVNDVFNKILSRAFNKIPLNREEKIILLVNCLGNTWTEAKYNILNDLFRRGIFTAAECKSFDIMNNEAFNHEYPTAKAIAWLESMDIIPKGVIRDSL